MIVFQRKIRNFILSKVLSIIILTTFIVSSVIPSPVYAQTISFPKTASLSALQELNLQNSTMSLVGLKVYPENPLQIDFIIDPLNSGYKGPQLKEESEKLIKYFLAGVTVPEEQMWVNLSPTEKDRIIPKDFGMTAMGRDLLAEDYILKQITSGLMDPNKESGKKLWDTIYQKMDEKYGVKNIPVEMLNKVWIIPQSAEVYVNGGNAFVVESKLKVMLKGEPAGESRAPAREMTQIIQDVVIPEIEKEVNSGESFAKLRQIYNALILATWYKRKMKESVLEKVYVGKNKIGGIQIEEKNASQKIYEQYLDAFKKGTYEYIKDEYDPSTQEIIPRKYFSGGADFGVINNFKETNDASVLSRVHAGDKSILVSANLQPERKDRAIIPLGRAEINDDLFINFPLKYGIMEILKLAGLPVPDGYLVRQNSFSDEEFSRQIIDQLKKDGGEYILRSLDDDIGFQAGLLDSYLIGDAEKDFTVSWKKLRESYVREAENLTRNKYSAYARFLSDEKLVDILNGRMPQMKPIMDMGLLQKVHQTEQSGVITSTRNHIVISFMDGLHAASDDKDAFRIIMTSDGVIKKVEGGKEFSKENATAITTIVQKTREVLAEYRRKGRLEWVIEFGANLFSTDVKNLNFAMFQVRRSRFLGEEPVDVEATPEIYRFGPSKLPVRGILKQVRTQADIADIRSEHIVLLTADDFDKNNLDLTQLRFVPKAIFIDRGDRSHHTGQNIRYIDTLSAMPKYFKELLSLTKDHQIIEVSLDRQSGFLNYEKKTSLEAPIDTYSQAKKSNADLLYTENKTFKDYIERLMREKGLTLGKIHADRKPEELNKEGGYFSTVINGVRLVLPPREEFQYLDNQSLAEMLIGPLRLSMGIYPNVILAFPSIIVDEKNGRSHGSMLVLYHKSFGTGLRNPDSIRAWNYQTSGMDGEYISPRKENILQVDNHGTGDEDAPLKADSGQLMELLKTFKKLNLDIIRLGLHFELTSQQRGDLAQKMIDSKEFTESEIRQVIGIMPIDILGTRYLVTSWHYKRAIELGDYHNAERVRKSVLRYFIDEQDKGNNVNVIDIAEGVKFIKQNGDKKINETEIYMLGRFKDLYSKDKSTIVSNKPQYTHFINGLERFTNLTDKEFIAVYSEWLRSEKGRELNDSEKDEIARFAKLFEKSPYTYRFPEEAKNFYELRRTMAQDRDWPGVCFECGSNTARIAAENGFTARKIRRLEPAPTGERKHRRIQHYSEVEVAGGTVIVEIMFDWYEHDQERNYQQKRFKTTFYDMGIIAIPKKLINQDDYRSLVPMYTSWPVQFVQPMTKGDAIEFANVSEDIKDMDQYETVSTFSGLKGLFREDGFISQLEVQVHKKIQPASAETLKELMFELEENAKWRGHTEDEIAAFIHDDSADDLVDREKTGFLYQRDVRILKDKIGKYILYAKWVQDGTADNRWEMLRHNQQRFYEHDSTVLDPKTGERKKGIDYINMGRGLLRLGEMIDKTSVYVEYQKSGILLNTEIWIDLTSLLTDKAMVSKEALVDNPFIVNVFDSEMTSIKDPKNTLNRFINNSYPLKDEIFSSVDNLSDYEIFEEVNGVLDPGGNKVHKILLPMYSEKLTIRDIFIRPTHGGIDVPQSLSGLALVSDEKTGTIMADRNSNQYSAMVRQYYLVYRAIEAMFRHRETALFEVQDADVHGGLISYLISDDVLDFMHTGQKEVGKESATRLMSFSRLLLVWLFKEDFAKEDLAKKDIAGELNKPENDAIKKSVINYLDILSNLSSVSPAWKRALENFKDLHYIHEEELRKLEEYDYYREKLEKAVDRASLSTSNLTLQNNAMLLRNNEQIRLVVQMRNDLIRYVLYGENLDNGTVKLNDGFTRTALMRPQEYLNIVVKTPSISETAEPVDSKESQKMAKIAGKIGYKIKDVDGFSLVEMGEGIAPVLYYGDNVIQQKVEATTDPKYVEQLREILKRQGLKWNEGADPFKNIGLIDGKPVITDNKYIDFADKSVGGIDFNAKNINIKESGADVKFHFTPDMQNFMESNSFTGFTPVIFNIVPIHNLPLILGVNTPDGGTSSPDGSSPIAAQKVSPAERLAVLKQ